MRPQTKNIPGSQEFGKSSVRCTISQRWTKGLVMSLLHFVLISLMKQEDSIISQDADESEESEYCPFELPEDEYGEMMFAKRLAAERSESPETSIHPESRRGSTVADTDGKT